MINKIKFILISLLALNSITSEKVRAMDLEPEIDRLLVVGCRPWDKNLEDVQGLNSAHFIDFMADGMPEEAPKKFHHVDLNDRGMNGSEKFSTFAVKNPGTFKTIIIDWATCHHIREHSAWQSLLMLLEKNGTLIIPVTSTNIMTGHSLSKTKAQELLQERLSGRFEKIEIKEHKDLLNMTSNAALSLLIHNRGNMLGQMLSSNPAIIFATK